MAPAGSEDHRRRWIGAAPSPQDLIARAANACRISATRNNSPPMELAAAGTGAGVGEHGALALRSMPSRPRQRKPVAARPRL
jgi:hypothetical protein